MSTYCKMYKSLMKDKERDYKNEFSKFESEYTKFIKQYSKYLEDFVVDKELRNDFLYGKPYKTNE